MNILFHCSEYPPYKSGGIGSITRIVAEGLSKMGHYVIVCGYYPYLQKGIIKTDVNGVQVYRFGSGIYINTIKRHLLYFLNNLGLNGRHTQKELDDYESFLQQLIKEHQIQLLELTDFYEFNYCKSKLNYHSFQIPVVMRVHGSATFLNHYRNIYNPEVVLNDRRHLMRTQHLSSVSRFAQDFLLGEHPGISFSSQVVIYNSIEEEFLSSSYTPSGIDSKTILYLGKLTKTKGAYNTILAFNRFVEDHPDWELVMIGSGNQKELLNMATEQSRKQIKFLGFCNREEIRNEIDNCSFACLPSFFESFSMTPLEVMARGKTVIYTERTSGAELIKDGVDGYLVDPSDLQLISDRMGILADNISIRERMSEEAFKTISSRFSSSLMLKLLDNYYSSIIRA